MGNISSELNGTQAPSPTSYILTKHVLKGVRDTGRLIGRGSFATVSEVEYQGQRCAAKMLHTNLYDLSTLDLREPLVTAFERECSLLCKLDHPNIVRFLGIYFKRGSQLPILVMEYVPTTLSECLDKHGVLHDVMTYDILRDVALGLCYLHKMSPPVVHRDLSANNILLTTKMNAKITDLGVAKVIQSTPLPMTQTTVPGCQSYMPPEAMVTQPKYTTKLDVFSFGVLTLHMLTAQWPMPSEAFQEDPSNPNQYVPASEIDRRAKYIRCIPNDHPLMEQTLQCLSNSPAMRLDIADCLDKIKDVIIRLPPSSEWRRLELLQENISQEEKQAYKPKSGPLDPYILKGVRNTGRIIGTGSFATVTEVVYHGQRYAAKKLHDELYRLAAPEEKEAVIKTFKGECSLLHKLSHPNIVRFLGIYYKRGSQLPILVMEYVPTTLSTCLDVNGVLHDLLTYGILRDAALGLHYLHELTPPVVHRDFSANNILLTSNLNAKITDLGVAKVVWLTSKHMTQTQVPGTQSYMPPDAMVQRPKYSTKLDVFSYGVLVVHMLTACWPIPSEAFREDSSDQNKVIPVSEMDRRTKYICSIRDNHPLVKLVKQCLSNNPARRPEMAGVLDKIEDSIAQLPPTSVDARFKLVQEIVNPDSKQCLKRDLIAAVRNDDHTAVGEMIMKGAENIDTCLKLARLNGKPHARAMLLLVKAAKEGNCKLILKLFDEPAPDLQDACKYQDDGFPDVQKAVVGGKVSTVVPIEIARRNGHTMVREELLLKTNVGQEKGTVYWHDLCLLVLDVSWLRKIHWVKRLRLSGNGFQQLPKEMGTYLKQVVKLDLQHNALIKFPCCILELPSLQELNLAHNELTEIPEVPEWSSCLGVLDLSHNQLTTMPVNSHAPAIRVLILSFNNFQEVPMCICSFTTLHSLDISENLKISKLPAEMGRLTNLSRLNLKSLRHLIYPPRRVQRDCRDCIRYLNSKLRNAKGFYHMKLMLVGLANRGKTMLVARLLGREYNKKSTVSVDITEWVYRPSLGKKHFNFSVWDFGGQEKYYATHQCFLSQRSLYLLLFNLKHGEEGVDELKPWLNNIALRAPRSRIIIIGTHLDEIEDEERPNVDILLQRAAELANSYHHKVEVMEVIPVGLKNRLENIVVLKEAIYNYAERYKTRAGQPIMGQKIPASYHDLYEQLEILQTEVRKGVRKPFMHAEEFKTMVRKMELADIQDDDELKTVTLFLTDVGSLLHYDDRSHNLHELYFIDPCWLCDMLAQVVMVEQSNPFIKQGILLSRDIPLLFKDKEFPWEYYEQYLMLLDRFEIALPLDNKRILIPSMLSGECPSLSSEEKDWHGDPLYSRYIIFASADTPPGFWSRLLSRIMHSVPQVIFALDKLSSPVVDTTHCRDFTLNLHGVSESPDPVSPSSTVPPDVSLLTATADFSRTIGTPIGSPQFPASDPHGSPTESPDDQNIGLHISGPISPQPSQQLDLAPELLPNFPSSLPFHNTFDPSLIKMQYWRHGLYYSDPEVLFRVEKLLDSKYTISPGNKDRDGVLIVTSPNNLGKKIMGQLVDLVVSLVSEWYPGLQEGEEPMSGLEQRVSCPLCLKMGRQRPFEFKVEHCITEIMRKQTTMECRFKLHEPTGNHKVPLTEIVPDLFLQDINQDFFLNPEDLISNDQDDSFLLGKGGYATVYRGKYHHRSVAIKKYLQQNEDTFSELRSEAKLLQKSHHPCLVCLVGVCIHPIMALVMEEAPMGSLEKHLIKKRQPIHRLTMYRMAAQVAAALRFLHQNGIIFRDLKAANVLLWTLDYQSLFHCKVTDFGIATHRLPAGAKGLIGTKGFIAPEVLYIGKRKQHSVYDHTSDIFSFGMFLYQLIARRHPYHDIVPQRIDQAVEQGEKPKLQDIVVAETGYHYLTRLMQMCWEDNPRNRPPTDNITKQLCNAPMQSVMCVYPVCSRFSLQHICVITPVNFTVACGTRPSSELWVCCNGVEGAEVNIYTTNTMVKVSKKFIDNQVKCVCLCGDHVWVMCQAATNYSVVYLYSITSRELIHTIHMQNSISCITFSESTVYLGTHEGYCFAFCSKIEQIQTNAEPQYKHVSDYPVDGIICTHQCIWVSHNQYIHFLNPDNLGIEGTIHRQQDGFIGQLSVSKDNHTIWSAHLGGIILSAWDANRKVH